MKILKQNQRGFTLIEIMVVVVILGILAAIVVPRLLDEPEKARRISAATQIRSFEEALGIFKLENGFYPSTEQGLKALVTKPNVGRVPSKYKAGGYIRKIPLDPWGQPYLYLYPGVHGELDLFSYGPDGETGGEGDDADVANWNLD
ncbi:MAG: type II secretion system major pseudopilin GspG [Desulfuromonadales bacterium]|nr:type II secretion system major pseudopilin GspG [Desulfuromonadales bacterium]